MFTFLTSFNPYRLPLVVRIWAMLTEQKKRPVRTNRTGVNVFIQIMLLNILL